jgi:membrane protein
LTSLLFVVAGTLTMASSLQQIYERAFRQGHGRPHDLPRLLTWVAATCGVVVFESVVGRPVRDAAGGSVLVELLTFGTYLLFFWWTIHFLLRGRISWRRLLPSAIATGVGFVALGVFAKFYFSSSIVSDDKTYGAIGAVFSIMTWLIGIGAVIMLGAVGGAVWQDRRITADSSDGHRQPT